ncbi:MAG: phosphate ABC transporter permease PstA [Sinobacteraceae bacterium]|nr:phosphate ABC transporter permease PstA [Nevskiaceae bacterium]
MNLKLYRRRRIANRVAMLLALVSTAIGLAWLALILGDLVWHGARGLSLQVFTEMTPPPGADTGGILNALYGSLVLTVLAVAIGTPVGLLAGTFMAEFGRGTKLTAVVRFVNDVLLSAPSIVIGLFVYEILVVTMGHFSAWAGGVALAILLLPVIVRTTEDALLLVPDQLREAASALGAPQWVMLGKIVYRAARAGLTTGLLLAVARVGGETAPLLFTSLNNQFWSTDMGKPMANLPVMIYQFALSPYPYWQQLAWTAALIITVVILALNIIARSFNHHRS